MNLSLLTRALQNLFKPTISQIVLKLRSLPKRYDLHDLRFHYAIFMYLCNLTSHVFVKPSILTFKWLCASNIEQGYKEYFRIGN